MRDKYYTKYLNLGLAISYMRRANGMTQQTLAEKMDVNTETISRMENANTGISSDMLFALSEALGVTLEEIFAQAKL